MRLARTWPAVLVVILVAACGGAGQAAPTPAADATPGTAAVSAPAAEPTATPTIARATATPAGTPVPLTEAEEMDEADFFTASVSFAILTGGWGAGGVRGSSQSMTLGSFQVDVTRAGPFAITEQDQQFFRLTIRVLNAVTEKAVFSPDALILSDADGNQYAFDADSSTRDLDLPLELGPGVIVTGYWLFQPVPAGTTNLKLAFKVGEDSFEYDLDVTDIIWPE